MNYGYQNEHDFVELFNNKYFSQLDENSKNFLTDLFPLIQELFHTYPSP